MKNQLIWNDRYNIGVEIIDKEHKKLFGIMNRLLEFSTQEDKRQWVCQEGIKYFKEHAMKHFSEEEVYMASISYPGFDAHRCVHDNFRRNTLPALEKELEETNFSKDSVNHFLNVCAGWLIGHTLTEDRAIIGKVSSRWVNLLPEEELTTLAELLIQVGRNMFELNTKLISARYAGEKFLNGIYYRTTYANKKGAEWETIQVFEEKLLLATVGKMAGGKASKLNLMLMNAARFSSKQFVECVMDHIPRLEDYELKKESLLSYEEFQEIFVQPQCSLLLDTGAGYFAFCIMPSQQKTVGISLNTNNEMKEMKKYLKRNEQQKTEDKKRKILIVDDSATVCLAMQKLLQPDYQVISVKSGMSAIRSITLGQPDLILLDYEMPVCDGPQVLQMIRAEEEYANIPVFFLTSKVNKESIEKVMPLKPEGYLSKSQRPADIKKNIDLYFLKLGDKKVSIRK